MAIWTTLSNYDPERESRLEEIANRLRTVLKTLTFRERQVIRFRYGFDSDTGGAAYTRAQCAVIFKTAPERIRQLEKKARNFLRNRAA